MVIKYSDKFIDEIEVIVNFISLDSKDRASEFAMNLKKKIDDIFPMPYRFRKNQKLNDEKVRDLIYKGYVVPFFIYDDHIEILGIFKENLHKLA